MSPNDKPSIEGAGIDSNRYDIVVVGGGITGMSAAIEAAELSARVALIEREPTLGGRVAQLNRYFPKLCPPLCGIEINYRRFRINPNVDIYTLSTVASISGRVGRLSLEIDRLARRVNEKCVSCAECEPVCPVERADKYNLGMSKTKAIYRPHMMSEPNRYLIDATVCEGAGCSKCLEACRYDAIDLGMSDERIKLQAGALIFATGWKPYDPSKIANLGYGSSPNIVTNLELERLAAPNGPTGGQITRRDNGEPIKNIAFAQCAGSRDENNLEYCSSICCMATLKQASYIRERYPEALIHIFYIDLRASGKYELFYNKIADDDKTRFIKGKIGAAEVLRDGSVRIRAEDLIAGERADMTVDMLVLATGMDPESAPVGASLNQYRFIESRSADGIFSAGVAREPVDVSTSIQDATGVALKALNAARRARSAMSKG